MIVTKQWLNEFLDLKDITTNKILDALNSIGLEVDNFKEINIPNGVVVGYVKDCIKHPNADKLNICQVDIGNEVVQIVCGASNVQKDIYVPVATIGANLGADFIIKKTKLRDEDSSGMICSSTEIALPKMNDGIMILDSSIGELQIGKELKDYPLLNDTIIEIELTANRGDCLSVLGVARDLGAYFKLPLKQLETKIYENDEAISRILNIDYKNDVDINILYKMVDIQDIVVATIIEFRIALLDIKVSTNIELLTHYTTHTTGVIINPYPQNLLQKDDKLHLCIYNDKNNFTNVDGNINLHKIGVETKSINNDNTTIVLEASYIDPNKISLNVFKSKEKTGDIYYKTSRGSNPYLQYGINYISNLLCTMNCKMYKGQVELGEKNEKKILNIQVAKINNIIGQDIKSFEMIKILRSLGFTIINSTEDELNIKIPLCRHDIENIADVTEEIVRIIGINNIKAKPLKIYENNKTNNISKQLIKKNKIRSNATVNGFFETITYIFHSKDLSKKYSFNTVKDNLDILNPINEDLNTLRTNIYLNLINAVSNNTKQGFKSISLFEYGIIFNKQREEFKQITFVSSGLKDNESLENGVSPSCITLFDFGQKLVNIVGEFELEEEKDINISFFHPYQYANIIQNNKKIGFIAKLHPSVASDFDINENTFIASFDFDILNDDLIEANTISKYQTSIKDLSIVVKKDFKFKTIKDLIDNLNLENLVQYNLIDIYSDKTLGEYESLTIRFVLQSQTKTLNEKDINTIIDTIINQLDKQLNIKLR